MEDKEQEMHENLERGLKNRHIQLIGLGGAIGVGLFLGRRLRSNLPARRYS